MSSVAPLRAGSTPPLQGAVRRGIERLGALPVGERDRIAEQLEREYEAANERVFAQPMTTPESPRAYELADFLSLELPPPTWLVEGLLRDRDIMGLHSWRGIGKTSFALSLALELASGGSFFNRAIKAPKGCLYVEGELPGPQLQERLIKLCAGAEAEPKRPLRLLCADLINPALPSLCTPEGQAVVESSMEDIEVVILDSVSTLFRNEWSENDDKGWEEAQEWLLALRRRGITTVVVYHDNKTGSQRGTSKREDVLSQVLQLRSPADYTPTDGARFEVHFTKARSVYGTAAEPFEARLETDPQGRSTWTWRSLDDAKKAQVLAVCRAGVTKQREIASATGLGLGTVNRKLRELRNEGAI